MKLITGCETYWQVFNRVLLKWVGVGCVEDGFDPLTSGCYFKCIPTRYRLVNTNGEAR